MISNYFIPLIFIVITRALAVPICPKNERWSCSCERTCQNPFVYCTLACINWKCVCKEKFYRHNGKCIELASCPQSKKCTNGKIYSACGGTACKDTCQDPTFSRRCRAPCIPGCGCPKGTVLYKKTNTCVKINKCPPTKCEIGCKFWHNGCSECECKNGMTKNCGNSCTRIFSRRPECVQCEKKVTCSLRKKLKADYLRNKALWFRHKNPVYQYTIQNLRFTQACFVQKMVVYVYDDKVSKIKFLDEPGKIICKNPILRKMALDIKRYKTIDQLFDYIQKLIDTADRTKIQYSKYGYPLSIIVDPMNHAVGPVDDEFSIKIDCLSFPSFGETQCDETICDAKCVCNLPKIIGPCRAAIPRYFYNKLTKKCQLFSYGGCRGNGNNFETIKECKNVCMEKPLRKKICDEFNCNVLKCSSLKSEVCVCDMGGKCSTYKNKCMACCNNPMKKIKSIMKGPCCYLNKCRLPKHTGLCKGYFPRYYYHPDTQACKRFIYGGCGGNSNNFVSKKDCEYECML